MIYAVDPSAGERHRMARKLLPLIAEGEGVLTQQVVGEFLNVSRRSAHLNQRRLKRIAVGLCSTFPILTTSRENLFDAFDLAERHLLQFWDSVIVTVCQGNNVAVLLTEDMQDGQCIGGLTILNPFLSENSVRIDDLLGVSDD